MDVDLIRRLAAKEAVAFKKHTFVRMLQRNIRSDEIQQALNQGIIVEEYPKDKPLPSCLILGYTQNKRPLHMVAALDEVKKFLWVITVYEPSLEEWEEGFEKRRNKL